MTRRFAIVSAAILALAGLAWAAAAPEGTWHGIITDDSCGKKHAEMKMEEAKACALKCVERGGKLALYDKNTDRTFILSDQAKAREFVAEHVVVKGTLGEDGKTINVTAIQKGEGAKEGQKSGR